MNNFKRKTVILCGFAMVVMFGASFLITEGIFAQEKGKKEKVEYKLNVSFEDNLLLFKGKYVRVTLSSGQSMSGYVKEVKLGLLHLEKLGGGRDYHDALIRTEDISAMDAKFRGFK
jgi:hypothetical protein